MMINSNPFQGLVKVILVLTLIGGAIGLVLAGPELLNPTKSQIAMMQAVEAKEDKDIAQEHARTMNAIEEAGRQDQIALDNHMNGQWSSWALGAADFATKVLVIALAMVVVCLAIGATLFLVQAGRSKAVTARSGTGWQNHVDWSDEDERWEVIDTARKLEIFGRLLAQGRSKHGSRRRPHAPHPGIPARLDVMDANDPEWRR